MSVAILSRKPQVHHIPSYLLESASFPVTIMYLSDGSPGYGYQSIMSDPSQHANLYFLVDRLF